MTITNLTRVPSVGEVLSCVESKDILDFHALTMEAFDDIRKALEGKLNAYLPSVHDKERRARKRELMASLVVPGVSELVDVYNMAIFPEFGYYRIDSRVMLAVCGRVYTVFTNEYKPKEPVTLALPYWDDNARYLKDFSFSERPPKRIGKATEKKLLAWVEYLKLRNEAVAEFIRMCNKRKQDFFDRLDASGVEYSKQYEGSVRIFNGPFYMDVSVTNTGIYPQTPKWNYPKDVDYLDYMLNTKL